ncbi:YceI family protein [Maribacter sp.]|nr:YceI family protein [Maribacter sp.]
MKKLFVLFFVCFCWMGIGQEPHMIASESTLTIAGTSTVHDWEVVANAINGSATRTDEVLSDLKIEVPVAEIKSERGAAMDAKMYEALKGEEYPSVHFSVNTFKDDGMVIGILSIAGVEKEIEVPVKIVQDSKKIGVSGMQEILLKDYGMEPPTAMFGQIVVGDTVTVKFDLIFQKK